MKVTIEHSFCPYCDEVTELYFRIINTILFSGNEAELRESMRQLEKKTPLDEYFTYGYGARHLWVCQRRPSDKTKIFEHDSTSLYSSPSSDYSTGNPFRLSVTLF